ncbi:MAG: Tim44 domain-containing protein [Proteobacteria bacterium]|nr:Tim44 domain-containing protein [Pseudomonadota bacterium]
MGDGFAFFDIIFFAMVAGFLILRLRGVLGRRTGNEKAERWTTHAPAPVPRSGEPAPDAATHQPGHDAPTVDVTPAPAGTTLDAGLTQIKLADPGFDPKTFLGGARGAFEMVINAFAHGDTAALRPLVADEVYDNFATAVRERQAAKHTLETSLIAVKAAEIVEARMDGRTALVTVKFVSEQVNVTRDAGGVVVEGDPAQAATITDVWTFSRNTRARDPNWALAATAAQH